MAGNHATDLFANTLLKLLITDPMKFITDYNYFSTRHGSGVSLSENDTVVTAIALDNAVAYTALPIPVGRLFQLKNIEPGIIVSNMIVCSSQLLVKLYLKN